MYSIACLLEWKPLLELAWCCAGFDFIYLYNPPGDVLPNKFIFMLCILRASLVVLSNCWWATSYPFLGDLIDFSLITADIICHNIMVRICLRVTVIFPSSSMTLAWEIPMFLFSSETDVQKPFNRLRGLLGVWTRMGWYTSILSRCVSCFPKWIWPHLASGKNSGGRLYLTGKGNPPLWHSVYGP